MLHSSHYNLNLAEGTDLVNPLTVDVPNYQTIDNTMFANEQAGIGTATELKSGTIHAITRANQNRNVFKFTASSVFELGDTFTVDGATVTALYPDQSSLKDRCFIVGSEVLCLLTGSQLTVLTSYIQSANEVPFDSSNVLYTATNAQKAIENASTATGTEYGAGVSVKSKIDSMETNSVESVAFSNTKLNSAYTLRFEKVGKIVELKTTLYASADIAPNEVIGTAPVGYRPTTNVFGNTKGIDIDIAPDGTVSLKNTSAPLGAGVWYVLTMTYIV